MKIPETLKIMGRTIRVVYRDDLFSEESAYGKANISTGTISLQSDVPGYPVSRELMEECFLHELMHIILWTIGRKELHEDEVFVDLVAGLLHQALTTGE